MLKIRLQRVGRVHMPVFRVVLTDSRNSTKSGKSIETLGTWNNTTHERRVDAERVKYWLSKGAQPSVTLHNFLISQKIIDGKKKNALPKHRPIKPVPSPVEGKEETASVPVEKPVEVPVSTETPAEVAPAA
ncbi:MAG: 30S ribosomal protein S16 [bacterium]|nr:30S ribosomal protein S16 [bacterium]